MYDIIDILSTSTVDLVFQDSTDSIDILVSPACLTWPAEPIKVEDQNRGMVIGWSRTSNDKIFTNQVSLPSSQLSLEMYAKKVN